jgi:hypothetical protein
MASAFDRFGDQAMWQEHFFAQLSEEEVIQRVMEVPPQLDEAIEENQFWLAETLDQLLSVLEAPLTAVARAEFESQTGLRREATLAEALRAAGSGSHGRRSSLGLIPGQAKTHRDQDEAVEGECDVEADVAADTHSKRNGEHRQSRKKQQS